MTDRATRNRANAQKSTGPKSERGRAAVAGNARRHGATARPRPDSVAAWLAVILDRPCVTPADLLPGDEAGYRALALAEAEVRRTAAEEALRAFEAEAGAPDATGTALSDLARAIMEDLPSGGRTVREVRSNGRLLRRITSVEIDGDEPGGKRHRLLRRYAREARAGRRRAFEAWAASRAGQADAASLQPETPNSRNKARMQSKVVYSPQLDGQVIECITLPSIILDWNSL